MSVELRRADRSDAEFLFELVTGDETREFLGRAPDTLDGGVADIERSEREPEAFGWLEVRPAPAYTVCARRDSG